MRLTMMSAAMGCRSRFETARGSVRRNTAFTFKGKNADARQIGKELGVRYVLEGSVQRDQNQVRVNAQLIDAQSGGHLWAERFDKPLSNLSSACSKTTSSPVWPAN